MKSRYIFIKDADISPMGYAQNAPATVKKKHFKKGDVVWGKVYMNAVRVSEPPTQGYALHVPLEGSKDISEGWDVPLPPLAEDSPVKPYPIITVGRVITGVVILGAIYGLLKVTKVIK